MKWNNTMQDYTDYQAYSYKMKNSSVTMIRETPNSAKHSCSDKKVTKDVRKGNKIGTNELK